ncbi:MAG TPA: tetratricopeptide repeat protein, partial [Dehalococcoidia bacterium]|nr:tetratricopeptide repeat protein [Dehalococcoidia bacterium]
EDAREELFWAIRRFAETLATRGPLILAFEDAHSADAELLDLIESLARTAVGPILLVCLARPELLVLRPGWGGGQRNYTSLFLEPLAEADTHALIESLLSSTDVPHEVQEVIGRTGGNPLFIEETLRMLLERRALVRTDGQWEIAGPLEGIVPDTVQGVITARLDHLDRREKLIALDASVLGKDFWGGALEAISGDDRDVLAAHLAALVEKDFLIERASSRLAGQREFTFKHLLIRDVAYSMLPKAVRIKKHGACGNWLEQTRGERAEEFVDLLAYHWLQTTRLAEEVGAPAPDSAQKALRYALLAGHRAAHVYANDQALSHFQTAEALASGLDAGAERISAIEGQADVFALQARWPDASRLYQEALDYHLRQGNVVAQAKMQSRMGSTFSGIFDFRQALPHVKSAMESLKSQHDERELAAIYLQMARTHTAMGQLNEAEGHAQMGLALARQHSLLPQIAEGEWALGFISTLTGRDDAPQQFARCIEIAERVGELGWVIQGLAWTAFRHRWRGEYPQAREAYARALAIAEQTSNRPRVAFCLIGSGETHFLSGNWPAAAETWERYLKMSDEVPAWVEHVRATSAFMEGNITGAVEWAERFLSHAERRREVTSIVLAMDRCAAYYLRAGRFKDAQQVLGEALQRFGTLFWGAFFHPLAAEAALAAGEVTAASEHCAKMDALPWADIRPARARLLRARGMIAASSGDLAAAISLLDQVVEIYRQIGQLYDCARALEELT